MKNITTNLTISIHTSIQWQEEAFWCKGVDMPYIRCEANREVVLRHQVRALVLEDVLRHPDEVLETAALRRRKTAHDVADELCFGVFGESSACRDGHDESNAFSHGRIQQEWKNGRRGKKKRKEKERKNEHLINWKEKKKRKEEKKKN